MRIRILAWAAVGLAAAGLWTVSAGAAPARSVWILHATDVHPFVDVISSTTLAVDKSRIERQRALNLAALKDLLARAPSLVGAEGEPRLLILSGDLDSDPCWISAVPRQTDTENRADVVAKCIAGFDTTQRTSQIQALVDVLADSPIHDVIVVAGNNDVAREAAGTDVMTYFAAFVADIQKGLTAKNSLVRVRNLSACYGGGADTDCVADVADTPYRIVAFPSHSFKNVDAAALAANDKTQQDQLAKFSSLLAAARTAHRKAIVVTHIPNIDDPFSLAQDRFAAAVRPRPDAKVDKRSTTSAWNVTKPVLDAWVSAATSDDVAAVLAGHLHDSHKEIYRAPYTWAPTDPFSQDREKLILTPPLSVTNQDGSPIQARGASLLELLPDRVRRVLVWYEPDNHRFIAETAFGTAVRRFDSHRRGFTGRLWHWIRWVWSLGDTDRDRLAVLLIAFLAAFLTVTRVWQIPPPDNPFASAAAAATATASAGTATVTAQTFDPSPFAGNFGKVVIAGLGGLVAETVLKSLTNSTQTAADKEFYVIWFVLFFLSMLLLSAFVQAAAEAVRVRLAIVQFAVLPEPAKEQRRQRLWSAFKFWLRRFWLWLVSLRLPLLVFVDSFVNRIQGRNQTLTSVFQNLVIDEHENVISVIDTIRRQLKSRIEAALNKRRMDSQAPAKVSDGTSDVRVNISVMSADRSSVFYVAATSGSAVKEFSRRSVAWVSVFTGKIRWYLKRYKENVDAFAKIVLFDNTAETIPNDEKLVMLQSHYQPRDEDYEAFVVFPIPWPRRGSGDPRVLGAIHISFRRQSDFEALWHILPDPVLGGRDPNEVADASTQFSYKYEDRMLDERWGDAEAVVAVRDAIDLVAAALQGFNENVYRYTRQVGSRR